MKKLNNNGFTLVELLAVIVILAIIMAIAATMVLPIIDEARKGSFASTAMVVADAAEQAYSIDYLSGDRNDCYSISDLVTAGYLESVDVYDASGSTVEGQYDGYVVLVDNLWYVYLNDHTNNYVISGNTGTIDSGDVVDVDGDSVTFEGSVCPSEDD